MSKYIIKNCPTYRTEVIETYPTMGLKQLKCVCSANKNLYCKEKNYVV